MCQAEVVHARRLGETMVRLGAKFFIPIRTLRSSY